MFLPVNSPINSCDTSKQTGSKFFISFCGCGFEAGICFAASVTMPSISDSSWIGAFLMQLSPC
jgi:hypothetical protein